MARLKMAGRTSACLLACLAAGLPVAAQQNPAVVSPVAAATAAPVAPQIDQLPEMPGDTDLFGTDTKLSAAKEARFTLGHEFSYRTGQPHHPVNNRSWVRLEYSRLFSEELFFQLDTKLNSYWSNDHRAEARDRQVLLESMTPEAFLQYSPTGGRTSVKLGMQRLIWGESEAGAITDEVSPRNLSELFFIPLEESRIGQMMLTVDRFAPEGDWTLFYVPDPKYNKYAKPGTAYYSDPFAGQADISDISSGKRKSEFGMRWKKTFGKSDVSLMAASLVDNDQGYRQDATTGAGRLAVSRQPQRFDMAGAAFNYATGAYLFKGEVGWKVPKAFNDANFQIVEKNVVDSSLGVKYSLGDSDTLGFELVNSHVHQWTQDIQGVPRDKTSLVLNATWFFLNDTLTVNWLTIYTRPYTSLQSSLRTSYKWTDDTTVSFDAHVLNVPDTRSPLYRYRHVDAIFFRLQHQF